MRGVQPPCGTAPPRHAHAAPPVLPPPHPLAPRPPAPNPHSPRRVGQRRTRLPLPAREPGRRVRGRRAACRTGEGYGSQYGSRTTGSQGKDPTARCVGTVQRVCSIQLSAWGSESGYRAAVALSCGGHIAVLPVPVPRSVGCATCRAAHATATPLHHNCATTAPIPSSPRCTSGPWTCVQLRAAGRSASRRCRASHSTSTPSTPRQQREANAAAAAAAAAAAIADAS